MTLADEHIGLVWTKWLLSSLVGNTPQQHYTVIDWDHMYNATNSVHVQQTDCGT